LKALLTCGGRATRSPLSRCGRGLLCLTLALAATGAHADPGISFSPSRLDYGNQLVGIRSTAQTLTITNSGASPLTISSLSFTGTNPGDFVIGSDSSEATLAPGASRSLGIQCRPLAVGARSAVLAVSDNAAGSPQLVSLSGAGVTTFVYRSPGSIDFGDCQIGAFVSRTVTVRNDGNSARTSSR
jgi:hypothetical protein